MDQDQLVRLVMAPDGSLLVDYRRRLPGRGAYVCPSRACLVKALRQGQFRRAFKSQTIEGDQDALADDLQAQILDKITSLIGMARKAGQLVGGSQLVLAALAHPGEFGLVILASDISPGVGDKVVAKAAAVGLPVWKVLTKDRLGGLVGRAERSALVCRAGQLCERLQSEIDRYEQIAGEH